MEDIIRKKSRGRGRKKLTSIRVEGGEDCDFRGSKGSLGKQKGEGQGESSVKLGFRPGKGRGETNEGKSIASLNVKNIWKLTRNRRRRKKRRKA